ncbi:hypothetical protein L198_02302 [Cryptococcus wingfieldii CBS 7118]|uniref:Uncharacterized protein n=1 Tax=Cryptococcus wingfieldii CBS 7118 TaxID=1295528 RepID=A0A1E3JRI4_9TREE|nr:hypothetical protein L198_02302 [Cryptococcus wingfieldii CBS 7118]ODO03455.1 hypothetical protein L198_02302 [Cryptococcus wingfieldii CBS 7118]
MDLPGVRAAWGLPVDGVPTSASADSRHLASSSSLERGVRPAAPEMMAETQRRARRLANDVFVGTRGNDLSRDLNAAVDTSHYPIEAGHPSVEAQGYDGDDDEEVVGADDSGYAERDSTGSGSQEDSTERDSEASPESKPRRKTARGCRSGKKVKEKREQRRQEKDRPRLLARRALLERQFVGIYDHAAVGGVMPYPGAGHGLPQRPPPLYPFPRQISPHRPDAWHQPSQQAHQSPQQR